MSGNQDIHGDPFMRPSREVRVRTTRDISRAIREARKRQGLSQEEISLATDINRTYLSSLESGHETAILNRLLLLIDSLGLELIIRPRDIRRGHG